MKWAQARRLDYIDYRLTTLGTIIRSDLMEVFGISKPQSSTDLATFTGLYPGVMAHDRRRKCYVAREGYRTVRGHTQEVIDLIDRLNQLGHAFGWRA